MARAPFSLAFLLMSACLAAPELSVPRDATEDTTDMSEDVSVDMSTDTSSDMPEDAPKDMKDTPCTPGEAVCTDDQQRRQCSWDREWVELATCAEKCVGRGECLPNVPGNSRVKTYTMPFTEEEAPAWLASVISSEVSVFGGWRFTRTITGVGAVHTVGDGDPQLMVWNKDWHDAGFPGDGSCSEFGRSMAISEDGLLLAVSAPGLSRETMVPENCRRDVSKKFGAVYLFTRQPGSTQWTYRQTLMQSDAEENLVVKQDGSLFGLDVELTPEGNRLFVGAARARKLGQVYVFDIQRSSGWTDATYSHRISPVSGPVPTTTTPWEFGSELAIAEGKLAIGARNRSAGSQPMGLGAVFLASTTGSEDLVAQLQELPRMLSEATQTNIKLGQSLAFDAAGNTLIAGASGMTYNKDGVDYQGRMVHWDLEHENVFVVDVPENKDAQMSGFGSVFSLSPDGQRLVVGLSKYGAPANGSPFVRVGSVLELVRDGDSWAFADMWGADFSKRGDFGGGISPISPGGRVIVSSAYEKDESSMSTGKFYEFAMDVSSD